MMEQLIFSKAYYKVIDFKKILEFFQEIQKEGHFSFNELDIDKKILKGSFLRAYPNDHWNPLSKMQGAMQVIGQASLENEILKIETMTKGGLNEARKIIETSLTDAIVFDRVEFKDPLRD